MSGLQFNLYLKGCLRCLNSTKQRIVLYLEVFGLSGSCWLVYLIWCDCEEVEASNPAWLRYLSRSSVKPLTDSVKTLTVPSIRDSARTAEIISLMSQLPWWCAIITCSGKGAYQLGKGQAVNIKKSNNTLRASCCDTGSGTVRFLHLAASSSQWNYQ